MTQHVRSPASSPSVRYRVSTFDETALAPHLHQSNVWSLHPLHGSTSALDDEGRYAAFVEPPPPPPLYSSSPAKATPLRSANGNVTTTSTNLFSASRPGPAPVFHLSPPLKRMSIKGKERAKEHLEVSGEHSTRGGKERDEDRIKLRNWYIAFQTTKAARRMHPKAAGLSHWIQLAGELSEAYDEHEAGQPWHSSLIVERVESLLLKTKSGGLYELQGGCDESMMRHKKGFTDELIDNFSRGFPIDWADVLVNEARRRGHLAAPKKRMRGKSSKVIEQQTRSTMRQAAHKEANLERSRHDASALQIMEEDVESANSESSDEEFRPTSRTARRRAKDSSRTAGSTAASSDLSRPTELATQKALPREILALSKTKWGRLMVVENAIMDGIEEDRAERVAKKRQSLPARMATMNPATPQGQVGPRSSLTPRASTRKRSAARKWWEVQEAAPPVYSRLKNILPSTQQTEDDEEPSDEPAQRPHRKAKELRAGQYATSDLSCVFTDSADDFVALPTDQDTVETSMEAVPTSSPLREKERKRLGGQIKGHRGKRARPDIQKELLADEADAFDPSAHDAEQNHARPSYEDEEEYRQDQHQEHSPEMNEDGVEEKEEQQIVTQQDLQGVDSADEDESPIHSPPTAPSSPASSNLLGNSLQNADVETGITSVSDDEIVEEISLKEADADAAPVTPPVIVASPLAKVSEQVSHLSLAPEKLTEIRTSIEQDCADIRSSESIDQDLQEYLVLSSSADDALKNPRKETGDIAGSNIMIVEQSYGKTDGAPRIVYDLTMSQDVAIEEDDESVCTDEDDELLEEGNEEGRHMSDEEYYCFSD